MRPDLIERVNDINISVISRLAQKSSIGKIMSLGTWIAGEKQKYFFFFIRKRRWWPNVTQSSDWITVFPLHLIKFREKKMPYKKRIKFNLN